jgi:DNA-binding GntR family transcriptional regulator
VRLSEKAYHLIKDKIVCLELEPLTVIDEQALMEDLGLGRTPIREALHRLAAEGLVIIAPRRGMFVADISLTDLQKIFEVRVVLEAFCARLAAQRATQGQLAKMEAATPELALAKGEDTGSLMRLDTHFHHLLYEAAGNEFLTENLTRLHALSLRLWYLVLPQLDDVKATVSLHGEIVDALKARDEARAEALVQQHVSEFQQKIRSVL